MQSMSYTHTQNDAALALSRPTAAKNFIGRNRDTPRPSGTYLRTQAIAVTPGSEPEASRSGQMARE
jgi:hypothetical protein